MKPLQKVKKNLYYLDEGSRFKLDPDSDTVFEKRMPVPFEVDWSNGLVAGWCFRYSGYCLLDDYAEVYPV